MGLMSVVLLVFIGVHRVLESVGVLWYILTEWFAGQRRYENDDESVGSWY